MQDLAHIRPLDPPQEPVAPPQQPHAGVVLRETYRLERMLGEGGMGTVYEASHLRLRRRFAVKILLPRLARQKDQLARFRREAEITSELGHPNIVEVVDYNLTVDGNAFIVMELLQGENLSQRLDRVGRLGLARTMKFLQEAASALHAVHGAGIVHRDLKPSNLFLRCRDDGTESVKLLDFGISKVSGSSTLTGDDLLGTPYYMSPEQAQGRQDLVDLSTDVFGMGAILYRMLSGHRPFEADTVPALLYCIVHEPAPPLHLVEAQIPRKISDVVEVAMSKDPRQRYSSMMALSRAFTAAVETANTVCGRRPSTRTYPAASSSPSAEYQQVPEDETPLEQRRPTPVPNTISIPDVGHARTVSSARQSETSLRQRRRLKRKVALCVAGLAAMLVVLLALTLGGREWTPKPAAGPLKLRGSMANTAAGLDRELARRPCDAPRAVARALLAPGEPDRQRKVLARLLQCSWLDEGHGTLARALSLGTRTDGLKKALTQLPSHATSRAEVELVRAFLLARLDRQTEMLGALDRWNTRLSLPGQGWISPELGLSMIAAVNPKGVPQILLKKHAKSLPARTSWGLRALAAGRVEEARQVLRDVQRQGMSYEPTVVLRTRLLLTERQLPEAHTSASRLAAQPGLWGQRGQHLLADILVAQGRVKEAVDTLKASITHDSLERPALAATTSLRLGDLCRVMRRRGCAKSAYQHAVILARRDGDRQRSQAARAMALVLEASPGKPPVDRLTRLLARLRGASKGDGPPASELDCISAWIDLRQGNRLRAARKFQRVAKGSPAFHRFRQMAAQSMLSLGRPEDVLQLLQPLIAAPAATEATHFGVAGLYVATRAARMAGRPQQAARMAQAFLAHWGSAEADLLESRAWRQRVLAVRAELATYRQRGSVLYGNGVTVGLVSRGADPSLRGVEERLAQILRQRYGVVRLARTTSASAPDRRWEKGRAPLRKKTQALVVLKPSTAGGRTTVQLRRLDASTLHEVARTTLRLPATEAALGKATLALFPRSNDPLLYGDYVAGVFLRCNHCLRRAARDEGVSASGAELKLVFAGSGRILPSRVTKVVPDTAQLTVCLRACVERLPVAPFGLNLKDRLTVDVQVSMEPRWAMLRTVPRLQLANN